MGGSVRDYYPHEFDPVPLRLSPIGFHRPPREPPNTTPTRQVGPTPGKSPNATNCDRLTVLTPRYLPLEEGPRPTIPSSRRETYNTLVPLRVSGIFLSSRVTDDLTETTFHRRSVSSPTPVVTRPLSTRTGRRTNEYKEPLWSRRLFPDEVGISGFWSYIFGG